MSYTKTTWTKGDVITAQKLNNIENGIESSNVNFKIINLSELDQPKQTPSKLSSYVNTVGIYESNLTEEDFFNTYIQSTEGGLSPIINIYGMYEGVNTFLSYIELKILTPSDSHSITPVYKTYYYDPDTGVIGTYEGNEK